MVMATTTPPAIDLDAATRPDLPCGCHGVGVVPCPFGTDLPAPCACYEPRDELRESVGEVVEALAEAALVARGRRNSPEARWAELVLRRMAQQAAEVMALLKE